MYAIIENQIMAYIAKSNPFLPSYAYKKELQVMSETNNRRDLLKNASLAVGAIALISGSSQSSAQTTAQISIVATYNDIRNISPTPAVGHVIKVTNKNFYGDFIVSEDAGAIDNGGTIIRIGTSNFIAKRIYNGEIFVNWFDAYDSVSRHTIKVQKAIDTAIAAGGIPVRFTAGKYEITDTITISNSSSLILSGDGERNTEINFINSIPGKVLFDLTQSSSNTTFSDLFITENKNNYGTSICLRIQDTLSTGDSYSHYKDQMARCRVYGFNIAVLITTANPLDGTTHGFCSECMFFHTRFRNNRTTFKIQNIQAVNLTLLGTDIENDDADESYTFFLDEVGGDYKILGGSFVGKGTLYSCFLNPGSEMLWKASKFSMKDCRIEARAPHSGILFKPVSKNNAIEGYVQLDGCSFLLFSQNLSLVDFGGKTNILVTGSKCYAGTLSINLFPTAGVAGSYYSDDGYYQSYGSAVVKDSFGFIYNKKLDSHFGAYDERYTIPITIQNSLSAPSGSWDIDNGFMKSKSMNYQQRAIGLGSMQTHKMVYNIDRPFSSFTNVKFILPFAASPTKLLLFKHPSIRSQNVNFKLYAVKDIANWANSGSFSVTTDAIQIADSVSTANKAGYLEFPINLISNYFDSGSYFESGKGNWKEGRMYLEISTGSNMHGFVGVEYI